MQCWWKVRVMPFVHHVGVGRCCRHARPIPRSVYMRGAHAMAHGYTQVYERATRANVKQTVEYPVWI